MKTSKFYYRRLFYYARLALALAFLGFIGYFVFISYEGFLPDPSNRDPFMTYFFYFFVAIVSLATLLCLSILIKSAKIAFSSAPALAMDEEKLVINGKRKFSWADIDYIKYVKGRVTSTTGRGVHGRSVYYLHIKPEHGRKIKVDITQIDGQHSDIFDSFRAFAPHLLIKGWKN